MTEEIQVKIEAIDHRSPHLHTVIALGRANTKTLGFLRDSAFADYAARGGILVALDPHKRCIGYIMYYPHPPEKIIIRHLCVDKSWQSRGIAKQLVNHLSQTNREFYGLSLDCRSDYKVSHMWPKLNFVAKGNKPAKTPGKWLTFWWLDHGHPNLFSNAAIQQHDSKLFVVIDANIFFELYTDKENSEEAKLLLVDRFQPELELCVTDEIFNKIYQCRTDEDERNRQRQFARKFTCLSCQDGSLEMVFQSLRTFFSEQKMVIDESDMRYLARAITSNIFMFVTGNIRLLDMADEIYEKFKFSIISPTDLIIKLEYLGRKPDYQPVRLAGTLLDQNRVHTGQDAILNDYFHSYKQGETKADFQQRVRRFLAEQDKFECSVVKEGENQLLALVVYGRHKKHELEIPMFRVVDNPLSATLARHLILKSILRSALEQRQFTRITDQCLEETVTTAISEDRFIRVKDGWLRANIAVAETASQLSQHLTDLATNFGEEYNFCREIAKILNADGSTEDAKTMLEIERFLWPAKIIDADIPTFIISIKPKWAQELFDDKLANQTIFGATKTELALNREAVYYKSKTAPKELKPGVSGRILWYVTDDADRGYDGISAVRACSRLDEVFIGKPKELFRRFQNLGVYEWKDVFDDVADKNLNNDIMAIRFSDSQLLNKPIALKKLQEVLGHSSPILSPRYISKEKFTILYALGTQT